ncbi:hypothetical protein ACIQRS_07135 [Streptomyces termitum]|uniref:Uncharacterized protein n=1 Tax=Streptomyces termitum TaxID=67368 RepID=A0A918SQR9_9ACTN|nr:hypothetical protein [Streptomyces termitum]GHA66313.1 hypothetical protein GCM10010305_05310 [Streptomyces termitum]
MSRLRPLVVAAVLLGLTGCAPAVDPLARLGGKAVHRIGHQPPPDAPVRAEGGRG